MKFKVTLLIISILSSFSFSKTILREKNNNPTIIKSQSAQNRSNEDIITIDFEGDVNTWTQDNSNGWELTTNSYSSASHSFNSADVNDTGELSSHSLYSEQINLPDLANGEIIQYSFSLNCDMPDFNQQDNPNTPADESQYLADYYIVSIRDINESAWHISNFNSLDGNSWWCADEEEGGYLDNWFQYLDTPEIQLPIENSTLTVDMKWAIEDPTGATGQVPGTCVDGWDQANVQISNDNGTTWNIIEGDHPYDFDCGYGTISNGLDGMPGWGGIQDWHNVSFDLSEYNGQNIKIRFAFYSDVAWSINDESTLTGLQIDNIEITTENTESFIDTADDENNMAGSGASWIDQFYDYCDTTQGYERPGSFGWDTYDEGDAFTGNISMDIRSFSGKTIQFRFQTIYDGNTNPQGEGLYIDDLKLYKENAGGTRPINLTGTYNNTNSIALEWDDLNISLFNELYGYDNNIFPTDNMFNGSEGCGDDCGWIGNEMHLAGISTIDSVSIYIHNQYMGKIAGFSSNGLTYNDEPDYEIITDPYTNFTIIDSDGNPAGMWISIPVDWTFNGNFIIAQQIREENYYPIVLDPTSQNTSHSKIFINDVWQNWSDIISDLNSSGNNQFVWEDGAWGIRTRLDSTDPEVNYNVYRNGSLIQINLQNANYQDDNLNIGNQTYTYTVSATYPDGSESAKSDSLIITANYLSVNNELEIPEIFTLKQNFPNPFNPTTTIAFSNPKVSDIDLIIYNVLGQEVFKKTFKGLLPGNYEYVWDGKEFNSGLYIYTLQNNTDVQLKEKMLLIK